MACYHPIHGYQGQDGRFILNPKFAVRPMVVPCGGCVGCRLRRSGEWSVRGTHHASMYSFNSFITLTFDSKRLPFVHEGQLPADVDLHYPLFQTFMKDLRAKYGSGISFIVAGEYGDDLGRPHFHAILFNFTFPDRYPWYRSKQGHQVFRSPDLERLWPWGNSDIGSVTPQSIAYVARYVMKKVNGNLQADHYRVIDKETGEILGHRKPEFAEYSNGIGRSWFEKYHDSVFPHDYIIFNGRKVRPPRYYDKLYEAMTSKQVLRTLRLNSGHSLEFYEPSSSEIEDVKFYRAEAAEKHLDDCTPERLRIREQVALAKVSALKRKLT